MRGPPAVSTSPPPRGRQWSCREFVWHRIEFITPAVLDLAPSDMCGQVRHIKHRVFIIEIVSTRRESKKKIQSELFIRGLFRHARRAIVPCPRDAPRTQVAILTTGFPTHPVPRPAHT